MSSNKQAALAKEELHHQVETTDMEKLLYVESLLDDCRMEASIFGLAGLRASRFVFK